MKDDFNPNAPEADSQNNLPPENTPPMPEELAASTDENAPSPHHRKNNAAYYYSNSNIPYGASPSYGSTPSYGVSSTSYGAYGASPSYYGRPTGSNGPGYYYGNRQNESEEEQIFGSFSLIRIIRVTFQRWPSLVVAVVIGLIFSFVYYKAKPRVYKATSTIEINVKPPRIMNTSDVLINDPNAQGSNQEIFSTRLATLKSMRVIKLVSDHVRANYPALKTMSDDDLTQLLRTKVSLDVLRHSRLCNITVRYTDPAIAKAIADAYAETARSFSMDENKDQAESSVAWLSDQLASHKAKLERASAAVLKFRKDNQLDPMISDQASLAQTHSKLSIDMVEAESARGFAKQLLDVLTAIQKDPTKFSSIPENTPRASEISEAQKALQNANTELEALQTKGYTIKHPLVEEASNKVKTLEVQYREAVARARETAAANYEIRENQVKALATQIKFNFEKQQELGTKIAEIESQLKQLEFDEKNATEHYITVARRTEEARISSDETFATVRIIENALLPKQPFSPDPRIVFSAGAIIALIVGLLSILAVDRIEDHITSVADIKQNLRTTILGMIPRTPRTKRTQLALLSATKKFSSIAEAFAGLRGLLDSPRYESKSKVILLVSTQPEEGKTISASNLALSFALSGKRTLFVDLDLRRPRVARIYGVDDQITPENNFIEVLANDSSFDFDNVPIESGFDNLDLVVSAVSSQISPATIIGSEKMRVFFDWARANYDRVIVDSSPFGLVADVIHISALCDSTIIVCRPHKSRLNLIKHAITVLRESGANVIGLIANEINFRQASSFTAGTYSSYNKYSKYRDHYGYGYGYGYKRAAKDDITVVHRRKPEENAAKDAASEKSPSTPPKAAESELDVDEEE